jgi:hypothetical protein
LKPREIYCDRLLYYPHFGIFYQEISGNPDLKAREIAPFGPLGISTVFCVSDFPLYDFFAANKGGTDSIGTRRFVLTSVTRRCMVRMHESRFSEICRQSFMKRTDKNHRNLSTRTRMFELLLQTLLAKNPCKKSADVHPRQGNLLHWNIFTGLYKNLSSLHKIGWRPAEKNSPVFFNMRVLDLDFYDKNTYAKLPLFCASFSPKQERHGKKCMHVGA